MAFISYTQVSKMSYNQLTKALSSGEVTEKYLRSAYSALRAKATRREKSVSRAKVVNEFGNTDREYFRKSANLPTTSELLHELVDVNKFLGSKRSTITGLKQQRENTINAAEKMGFDVDRDNYKDFVDFMKWFKSSEYAKLYDSDSEEVAEVFNSTVATAKDWKKAFKAYQNRQETRPAMKEYNKR